MRFLKSILSIVVCVVAFTTNALRTSADESDMIERIDIEAQSDDIYISSLVQSNIYIDNSFGDIQCVVDAQIYKGMTSVCNKDTMVKVYGSQNTSVFNYACDVLNPCMAFATSKGEAGASTSEPGVSLTTVIATNSRYYVNEIDWVSATKELSQFDEIWYLSNCDKSFNTNVSYKSAYMPSSYLQNGGSDSLGIGPYQITTSNWSLYTLEDRMSPTKGWIASLRKAGTNWLNYDIEPISDLTIMSLLSMSHQGGSIINSDVGKRIIDNINTEEVQVIIEQCGQDMYKEVLSKVQSGSLVSADSISVNKYVSKVYELSGIDFSKWSYGTNSTNTGNYVIAHTLQYVFYKYYFGLEV